MCFCCFASKFVRIDSHNTDSKKRLFICFVCIHNLRYGEFAVVLKNLFKGGKNLNVQRAICQNRIAHVDIN